tara:strand:+ start:505 stop:1239 length:735 start_codon:yes stop_codon:yes gene_type:complete
MLDLFLKHVDMVKETKPGQFLGLCPFHDDRHPSFSFNEDGAFLCYACETKGSAVDFAKMVGENVSNLPKVVVSKKKVDLWSMPGVVDVKYNDLVFSANEILVNSFEKFTKGINWNIDIVRRLFVGWDNGFIFPYLNGDGDLVNIKWHKKKQIKGHAQTFIYPYWHMMEKYKSSQPLYVVEGEKDCIALISEGKQVITFNNGANSNVPKVLVDTIKKRFSDVILMLDPDEAGRKAEDKLMRIFNA